jgi:hypothetical protein
MGYRTDPFLFRGMCRLQQQQRIRNQYQCRRIQQLQVNSLHKQGTAGVRDEKKKESNQLGK